MQSFIAVEIGETIGHPQHRFPRRAPQGLLESINISPGQNHAIYAMPEKHIQENSELFRARQGNQADIRRKTGVKLTRRTGTNNIEQRHSSEFGCMLFYAMSVLQGAANNLEQRFKEKNKTYSDSS